jgi:hypothetical protein
MQRDLGGNYDFTTKELIMMNRRNTIAAALASALLLPVSVFAAEPVQTAVGEAGIPFQYVPNTVSRDQVRADLRTAQRNPVASAGWRYSGGEAGWSFEGHRVVFDEGRPLHARDCTLYPARPSA